MTAVTRCGGKPGKPERVARNGEAHNALIYARRHLKTHCDWRSYLQAGGDLPHEKIGDLEHHEQAIHELNLICKVLRRAIKDSGVAAS